MAKKITYADFFNKDSVFEREYKKEHTKGFNKAAADSEENRKKLEVIVVNAYKTLDEYDEKISDEREYKEITHPAIDKWHERLRNYGIKIGKPIGLDKKEFYKELEF